MAEPMRIAAPPEKPVMLFDGDCHFCVHWIRRWQDVTAGAVDYIPLQDALVTRRFPELQRETLEQSVHLIETDGSVYRGAEAVFRALARSPGHQWPLWLYRAIPAVAAFTEWVYRYVATHRSLVSAVMRFFWGEELARPDYSLTRWIFLRLLALTYFIAFVSLWTQITGLIGHSGIIPAQQTMQMATQQVTRYEIGIDRYHLFPTLCWFGDSDNFLVFQCGAGAFLSLLLLIGLAPSPILLLLLWLFYLSLTTIGSVFLSFQWDNLLLETGLLAIFFAPIKTVDNFRFDSQPSRIVLWLLRWLLFRLMFESGCVKLSSGDPTWRTLTAFNFHFETQPLPTWIGWYAHQMPDWCKKTSIALMFLTELGSPFLIFGGRRPRMVAFGALVAFQLAIALTGNYGFFNLLTLTLCIVLLEDGALLRCFPRKSLRALSAGRGRTDPQPLSHRPAAWPLWLIGPIAAIVLLVTSAQLFEGNRLPLPRFALLDKLEIWLQPFRSLNRYGLFAVMTTSRPEIILEGSRDGKAWTAYRFKYKPGEPKERPRFVAPYMPRLDWQMWFAALGSYRANPWFINFCVRLLHGSPEVMDLLEGNPFPDAPPRFIRATVYDYHFADPATLRREGAWWRSELKGEYCPILSLRDTGQ